MSDPKFLLPWYINESLVAEEQQAVDAWLLSDESAANVQEFSRQIARAVAAQETILPAPQIAQRLISRVRTPQPKFNDLHQWAWGLPITVLLFALLWFLIQPGTHLYWSSTSNNLTGFRIYRAPMNSTSFELITEIPAKTDQNQYEYADSALLPGFNYRYVLEVVDQTGNTAISPVVAGDSMNALSTQFAIFLTSIMLTFGMITIAQEIKYSPQLCVSL